jgi:membrane protein YdbS with pleckstrin-like domain
MFQVFKLIHVTTIALSIAAMSITLYGDHPPKTVRRISILAVIFILISGTGMGLSLNVISSGRPPLWIIVKGVIWLAIFMLGVFFPHKLKKYRNRSLALILSLGVMAGAMAIFVPNW